MHLIHALPVILALLVGPACADSDARGSAPPSAAGTPSPTVALPSLPADARIVQGATKEIRLGSKKAGFLWLSVEATRTPSGVTVEARYTRSVNCKTEAIVRCTTKYDVRRRLPESAFSLDPTLGTGSLTTTVEGQPLTVTWTGYGDVERTANEYGALFTESREAIGDAKWGKHKHVDKQGLETTSLLFRRGYASA